MQMSLIARTTPGNPDPLAIFTQPPPNETDEQKVHREKKEAEAKRVSDEIDEGLKRDKAALKKEKESVVKVLLLGQSESGKSTTLKNFRLRYARNAWKAERTSWRAVIQLNVIHTVNAILDAIEAEMLAESSSPDQTDADSDTDMYSQPASPAHSPTPRSSSASSSLLPKISEKHRLLKLRLAPLRRIETDLRRRLGASTSDDLDNINGASQQMYATPFEASPSPSVFNSRRRRIGGGEVVVRSWKSVLQAEERMSSSAGRLKSSRAREELEGPLSDPDEATAVIASCKADIKALWEDPVVQSVLSRRKVKLADSAGFFMGQLDRIARRSYDPSDDDVIRARLRTLGVQENRIKFEGDVAPIAGVVNTGSDAGHEWIIYDVGGSRTMRAAWLPYFEDVNAIIFLAPISCFNEHLTEDPSVNRLKDSFILWRAICSSEQLAKAALVVFLNKCDLLEKKIRSGVIVKTHLPSFGERPNEAGAVIKYLSTKFKEISQQCSPGSRPRKLYLFPTSVIDTKATAKTLQTVRDGILRDHLGHSNLI